MCSFNESSKFSCNFFKEFCWSLSLLFLSSLYRLWMWGERLKNGTVISLRLSHISRGFSKIQLHFVLKMFINSGLDRQFIPFTFQNFYLLNATITFVTHRHHMDTVFHGSISIQLYSWTLSKLWVTQ